MSFDTSNGELPREGEARFFTFDSGNADLDTYYRDLLFTGPVGAWVDARSGKFGERVLPKHMYVTNWGTPDEHHVAWVYHAGLIETDVLEGYRSHHVVCDCAVEAEDSALPTEILNCQDLEFALADRAEFWSQEYSVPQVLGALCVQEGASEEPTLSVSGQEILMSSMLGFLDMERRHPQSWFGNWVSGMMEVETLARLVDQPKEEIVPFVEMLNEGGLLKFDGQTVKLITTDQTPIARTSSIDYMSYEEAIGISKKERTRRRMISTSRRLQRKLFRTHRY